MKDGNWIWTLLVLYFIFGGNCDEAKVEIASEPTPPVEERVVESEDTGYDDSEPEVIIR